MLRFAGGVFIVSKYSEYNLGLGAREIQTMDSVTNVPVAAADVQEGLGGRMVSLRGSAPHTKGLLATLKKYRFYYLLALPGMLFYLVFHYVPMFGIIIAFKDVPPFGGVEGIFSSPWVGFKHFVQFFRSYYFWNIIGNTLAISGLKLLWGFPIPIALALLINEVRNVLFKRTIQTISYLPHFLSTVVVAGLVMNMLTTEGGLVNQVARFLGREPHFFLGDPRYFRSILVVTSVWRAMGWNSIIYLAAMANVDPHLYEAAMIDGASKWQQARHITLPGISHVIVILLILSIGRLLDAGFELIFLLYSPAVYSVGDIIDTFVYRSGLLSLEYSYATAVGVFKSVLALILLLSANRISQKLGQMGIW